MPVTVELAARYDAEEADELVFLDITASSDGATRWSMWSTAPPNRSSFR
jgi:imidazole glycerol phosphate synthase subunit HisF